MSLDCHLNSSESQSLFSHFFEAPWQENIPRKCIGMVSEPSLLCFDCTGPSLKSVVSATVQSEAKKHHRFRCKKSLAGQSHRLVFSVVSGNFIFRFNCSDLTIKSIFLTLL